MLILLNQQTSTVVLEHSELDYGITSYILHELLSSSRTLGYFKCTIVEGLGVQRTRSEKLAVFSSGLYLNVPNFFPSHLEHAPELSHTVAFKVIPPVEREARVDVRDNGYGIGTD